MVGIPGATSPPRGTFELLEPCDEKLSRTVLGGEGAARLLTYPV